MLVTGFKTNTVYKQINKLDRTQHADMSVANIPPILLISINKLLDNEITNTIKKLFFLTCCGVHRP